MGLSPIVIDRVADAIGELVRERGLTRAAGRSGGRPGRAAGRPRLRHGARRDRRRTRRRGAHEPRGRARVLRLAACCYLQNATSGLAAGVTYGLVALALVIVFRATGVVNFAAGEMATFTTFIAWELIAPAGLPFFVDAWRSSRSSPPALGVRRVRAGDPPGPPASRVRHRDDHLRAVRAVQRPVELALEPVAAHLPGPGQRAAAARRRRSRSPAQNLGNAAVAVVAMLLLAGLFRFTKVGLGLRATADNPAAARVVGITPARMYALGWAMASVAGAIAGMLFANVLLLSPTMMGNVLVFSLVSVIVGGLESPVGRDRRRPGDRRRRRRAGRGARHRARTWPHRSCSGWSSRCCCCVRRGCSAGSWRASCDRRAWRVAARRSSAFAAIALGAGAVAGRRSRAGRRARPRRFWRARAADKRLARRNRDVGRGAGRRAARRRAVRVVGVQPVADPGAGHRRARAGAAVGPDRPDLGRAGTRSSAPARTPARCSA